MTCCWVPKWAIRGLRRLNTVCSNSPRHTNCGRHTCPASGRTWPTRACLTAACASVPAVRPMLRCVMRVCVFPIPVRVLTSFYPVRRPCFLFPFLFFIPPASTSFSFPPFSHSSPPPPPFFLLTLGNFYFVAPAFSPGCSSNHITLLIGAQVRLCTPELGKTRIFTKKTFSSSR